VPSVECIYLWQRCFDASKSHIATATGAQYRFSWRNKIPRCRAYAMGESNPVPAFRLWSGSGSKVDQFVHVPTRKMSSKSMHAFLSNLANRQTDRQTSQAIAFTSSVVGGNKKNCARGIVLLKLTTDRHEASHGLFATAEVLVC